MAGLAQVSLAGTNGDRPGTILDPATLARLACDAGLQRVLLAPNGAVLNLGRTIRYATAGQRKALTVRDLGCVIPGCGIPADRCDLHHVKPWAAGGDTDLDNLALVCPRHHTGVHAGIWKITIRDQIPWITRPRWADPDQTPLRNTTHHQRAHARHAAHQLRLSLNPPHDHPTGPPPDHPGRDPLGRPEPGPATPPTPDRETRGREFAERLRTWWDS